MNQPMLIKHRTRQEPLSTHQTLVRSLVRVELPHMIIQVRSNRKPTITSFHGALEGLHSLVEPQVLPQVTGLRVRLPTHMAQVLTVPGQCCGLYLARVQLLVVFTVLGAVVEHVPTDLATDQEDLVELRVTGEVVVLLVPERMFLGIN